MLNEAPSMILYTSLSLKGKSPLNSPSTLPAARSKQNMRSVSSQCLNAIGIVTVRLVSIRFAQNGSVSFTSVNGVA